MHNTKEIYLIQRYDNGYYEGEIIFGKRHGYGVYYCNDGGVFRDAVMQGYGMRAEKGEILELGNFKTAKETE